MQDIFQGYVDKENREIADHMHTEQINQQMSQDNAAQETAGGAMEPTAPPTPGVTDVPPPTA
jgi:hypothetical protein